MNTTRPVKLIKNEERKEPETQVEADPAADSNKWSTEVRSWVAEFQQNRQEESLQAFDSLFRDRLPEAGGTD
jgi:hypothetical protein